MYEHNHSNSAIRPKHKGFQTRLYFDSNFVKDTFLMLSPFQHLFIQSNLKL